MPDEIQLAYRPGRTVYALFRTTKGLIYDFNGSFVTFNPSQYASYVFQIVEQSSGCCYYTGNMLSGVDAGLYYITCLDQLGALPNMSDKIVGYGELLWDPVALGVGVPYYSGQRVPVLSGQLSGQVVNLLSGNQVGVWSGTSVNVFSGSMSGQRVNVHSGQLSGQLVTAASGVNAIVPSGLSVVGTVYSGMLSGQPVFVLSGQLSGQLVNAASGANVIVPSGLSTISTLYSGQSTLLYSGQFSGQPIPSGLYVNAALLSGQSVNVFSGQLSGQLVTAASGVNAIVPSGLSAISTLYSGQLAIPYSGSLSGQQVDARLVLDKSGYKLAGDGLDYLYPESGMNARQALSVNAAALAGQLSGATTNTITIDGANRSGTARIAATVDGSGNRTAITLNLPS